jgi:hypothetical protein
MSRFCAAAALVLTVAALHAQNISGTILGTVTDPSGARVAAASVTITNKATNQSVRVTTANDGYYEASYLPPGPYTTQVVMRGFKTVVRSDIELQVESRLRIDFTLEVGDASTSISVTGEAPLVESETVSLGQVVTGQEIEELPIKGRNVFDLAILVPGVQVNPRALDAVASTGDNNAPLFAMSDISINGGRYRTNDYLLDGVSIMLPENNNYAISPTPDGTQEFKVMTNSYGPQFGRSGGGVLNVVTKSGANQLHGSLYEFFRNDHIKANNFFANAAGQPKGPQHFNLFGASAGGPVVHNRTFFFVEYQGHRSGNSVGGQFLTLPTVQQRAGDFSQVVNQNRQPVIIYDPHATTVVDGSTMRLPFAGNRIPASSIDPAPSRC